MNKKWYLSKTLWTNAVMFAGVVIMTITGVNPMTPEIMAGIITAINVVLRTVTSEGLST